MVEDRDIYADEGGGLADLISALRRRFKIGLITALITFVVGALVTFLLPTMYTSTAVILIEEPEVPEQLVQTTVTTFAAQQIQLINQRVMTRTNLAQIIETFDLYAEKREYLPTLMLTDDVQQHMKLDLVNVDLTDPSSGRPIVDTIAFTVGFENESPKTAQQVANELVSLYLEENVRSRTVQTAETSEFLNKEVERLDDEVKSLEAEIARFKEENKDSLPAVVQLNMSIIQRTEDQLMDITRQLQSIEESRILLDAQLAQIDPTIPSIGDDGRPIMSPQNQLKALETELNRLRGKYSESHPDVQRAKRELQALRDQTGITTSLSDSAKALAAARTELATAEETYTVDHPEVRRLRRLVGSLEASLLEERDAIDAMVVPDNPAYIQISAQRERLAADESAYKQEARLLRTRLDDYEARVLAAPRVEQELFALSRQLETATKRYFAMRERQFGAEMGEALESESKGERFTLVEPPDLPLEPSSPNRPALLLVLLILAPAAGVGMILLREAMDPSIWAAKDVEGLQGVSPIAEIPMIMTRADKAKRRRVRLFALAGLPASAILAAVLVHVLVRPLDVLWYIAIRQLGI